MRKLSYALLAITILTGIALIGCSTDQNPVVTSDDSSAVQFDRTRNQTAQAVTISSATFCVRVDEQHGAEVFVHRITADWDEYTVTWGNFGGYDPTPVTSEVVSSVGYNCFDVTSLVQGWYDGDYPDYGLLLDEQGVPEDRTKYRSREDGGDWVPYLVVCFDGGGCDTIVAIADSYIWEHSPDGNFGGNIDLYTGYNDDLTYEKQALFRFTPPPPPELAEIGDRVWYDENCDGIQDNTENGVPGVTVYLLNCDGDILASTTTDADGYYWFTDLQPGDYKIQFAAPSGYFFSPQNVGGDDTIDSDADQTTGMTSCTTLDPGESDPTWDAGLCVEDDGCTLTIGFWKNWSGLGPQPDMVTPLLPIWLGDAGGTESILVTTNVMAVNILSQHYYCHPDNGITKLYAQLLGAKLNLANGAGTGAVNNVIDKADEFLADHDCDDWDSLSDSMKDKVLKWHGKLDDYNNGIIGPGHCL